MTEDRTTEPRQVSAMRATAHPVRLQILSLLTGAEMSAAEIARELDLTHANASYHVRRLAEVGLLVEAGEEKVRGGVAKRYRHPWDEAGVDKGTPEDVAAYVGAVAAEMVRRFALRSPGQRNILNDAEMWVPSETWERARDLVEEASRLVHSEAKPPRTPGTVHVALTAAAFRMTEPATSKEELS
jgi:DNA-binding transcriptional ArsR family regulator